MTCECNEFSGRCNVEVSSRRGISSVLCIIDIGMILCQVMIYEDDGGRGVNLEMYYNSVGNH